MDKQKLDPPPPGYQPQKCKGCVWGRFDGVKQFCPKIKCVKERRKT